MSLNDNCSLSEIRQLLNKIFDDADLEAFCLDHFQPVYDKFSAGMNKMNKLTSLLDYCRSGDRFAALCKAMCECDKSEFQAFFQEKGILVESQIDSSPVRQVAVAYNFDIEDLIGDCISKTYNRKGLVGFTVSYNSYDFLLNLCERLKNEWMGTEIRRFDRILQINAYCPVEKAVQTIIRNQHVFGKMDMIFGIQMNSKETTAQFWIDLCDKINRIKFSYRLIVIMAIESDFSLSKDYGIIKLNQPRFTFYHAHRWVKKVVNIYPYLSDISYKWLELIRLECGHDELDIEYVYNHLNDMLFLLQQNPTIERFEREIEERRIYVKTSS